MRSWEALDTTSTRKLADRSFNRVPLMHRLLEGIRLHLTPTVLQVIVVLAHHQHPTTRFGLCTLGLQDTVVTLIAPLKTVRYLPRLVILQATALGTGPACRANRLAIGHKYVELIGLEQLGRRSAGLIA
jgi:hypothetical protein